MVRCPEHPGWAGSGGSFCVSVGKEQAFADARQIVGVGEARNRTRRAVERTVPFGLICFSVVTVWYAVHGHAPEDAATHLRRHDHQTPPRHHRRKISRPTPSPLSSPHRKNPMISGPPPKFHELRDILATWPSLARLHNMAGFARGLVRVSRTFAPALASEVPDQKRKP